MDPAAPEAHRDPWHRRLQQDVVAKVQNAALLGLENMFPLKKKGEV